MTKTRWIRFVAKPLVFAAALVPTVWLTWAALTGDLTANPIQELEHQTGLWVLRFLIITLAITPVRRLTGWNDLIKFRRMTGLFAFYYACLHLLCYVVLDQFFDVKTMIVDIGKRPYITVGFAAFLLLIPLAATSTAASIRRLGGRRWRRLHQLIYLTAIGGVIHYWWLVKADISSPLKYGAIIGGLLAFRVIYRLVKSRSSWRFSPFAQGLPFSR
ncbi:MAG TPA: protein-methionine-sulfoxide reductase heme-binding subunit MsrQ, partial [Vicinamibacterales bacterium]